MNKKGSGWCPARYLNSQRFEELVINKIKEYILTPEHLSQLVEMVNEEMDASSFSYRQELETIKDEIIGINRRLENLFDAIETRKIDLDDVGPRI